MDYNQIFYKNWTTERYNWTIQIIPRHDTAISSPTYTELNSAAINVVDDLDSKFIKDIPVGAVLAESLKINIDMVWIPTDLRENIQDPVMKGAVNLTTESHSRAIDLYNIFVLSRQQKGTYYDPYDGDLPYPTVIKFIGAQKLQPETLIKVDNDGMDYDLELVNLIQLALQNTLPEDVMYRLFMYASLDLIPHYSTFVAHNYYFVDAKYMISSAIGIPQSKAIWFSYKDLFEQIGVLAGEILTYYLRRFDPLLPIPQSSLNVVGNPFLAITYHKRDLTDSLQGRGTALTISDLLFVGGIYPKDVAYPNYWDPNEHNWGYLIPGAEQSDNLSAYDNMWDYYVALAESKAVQMKLDFGNESIPYGCRLIFKKIGGVAIAPILDIKIEDNLKPQLEIKERELLLASSMGNLVGVESDDKSEFKTIGDGTMSDNDYTFKSIVHNAIQKWDDNKKYFFSFGNPEAVNPGYLTHMPDDAGDFTLLIEDSGFKLNKIYYKHTDNFEIENHLALWFADNIAIMAVHESIDIDDGINTPTQYLGYSGSPGAVTINYDNINEYLLPYQIEMNEAQAITEFIMSIFSSRFMNTCELDLDMNRLDIGTQYLGELYNFTTGLGNFKFCKDKPLTYNFLTYLEGKTILLKCTEKITDEEFSIKVLTLPELV